MRNWKTANDVKIYQVLSGRSNSYLIFKNGNAVLVDTGKEPAYNKLLKNIYSLFSITISLTIK